MTRKRYRQGAETPIGRLSLRPPEVNQRAGHFGRLQSVNYARGFIHRLHKREPP
jgi:hypothetical protein